MLKYNLILKYCFPYRKIIASIKKIFLTLSVTTKNLQTFTLEFSIYFYIYCWPHIVIHICNMWFSGYINRKRYFNIMIELRASF